MKIEELQYGISISVLYVDTTALSLEIVGALQYGKPPHVWAVVHASK